MSKRLNPSAYHPPGFDLDFAPFDADALRDIIAYVDHPFTKHAVGRLDEITNRLNTAAIAYKFQLEFDRAPTARMERNTLEQIGKAAKTLHALLPVSHEADPFSGAACNPEVPDGISRLLDEPLRRQMLQLIDEDGCGTTTAEDLFQTNSPSELLLLATRLYGLIAGAVEDYLEQSTLSANSANSQVADLDFTRSLCRIYQDLFDRPIQFSRNSENNAPQGPLIRFLTACFERLLDCNPSSETLVRWVRSVKATAP